MDHPACGDGDQVDRWACRWMLTWTVALQAGGHFVFCGVERRAAEPLASVCVHVSRCVFRSAGVCSGQVCVQVSRWLVGSVSLNCELAWIDLDEQNQVCVAGWIWLRTVWCVLKETVGRRWRYTLYRCCRTFLLSQIPVNVISCSGWTVVCAPSG